MKTLAEDAVREALSVVMDPEIPTCSITDLGIVHDVRISSQSIEIDLLPTFAGCPALDVIREDVEAAIRKLTTDAEVRVRFVNDPPWTTDRISVGGREAHPGDGRRGRPAEERPEDQPGGRPLRRDIETRDTRHETRDTRHETAGSAWWTDAEAQ